MRNMAEAEPRGGRVAMTESFQVKDLRDEPSCISCTLNYGFQQQQYLNPGTRTASLTMQKLHRFPHLKVPTSKQRNKYKMEIHLCSQPTNATNLKTKSPPQSQGEHHEDGG